jgi:hypothetical protein
MKKNINLIFLTLLIIFTNTNKVYATHYPYVYGDAAVLKIIIRKLEICTGFQGGHSFNIREEAFCNDALVIGEGDEIVDISGVNAGETAAAYGQSALLPFGETYTHVRLTLDKKFVMKNFLDVNGKGLNTGGSAATSSCNTKKLTDDMYGNSLDDTDYHKNNRDGWTESRYKYSTFVSYSEDENGIPEETNIYMIDGAVSKIPWNGVDADWSRDHWTHWFCYGPLCRSWGYWTREYGEDGLERDEGFSRSAVAMSIPRASDLPAGGTPSTQWNETTEIFDSTDDLIYVFELKKPYTVKATKTPSLDIAFNTKQAIMVFEVENGEETGQCPAGAKQNGTCDPINQGEMCAFGLGKVLVEIEMKDSNPKRSRRTRSWR